MNRQPQFYYFIMNRQTREYAAIVTTRRAAESRVRHWGKDRYFVVRIPADHVSEFHAAYMRQTTRRLTVSA